VLKQIRTIIVQAIILAVVSSVVALGFNAFRPAGLPLVAGQPYMIYTDCPMMRKEATPVAVADWPADLSGLVLVDARPAEDFGEVHLPGSRNLPYHPLKSPPAKILNDLIAAGPNTILVVGDVEINSGRLLAAEFAEAGCLGVRYVEGGWPALVAAGFVEAGVAP